MAAPVAIVPGLSFNCACFVIHLPRLAPRLVRFKVRVCASWFRVVCVGVVVGGGEGLGWTFFSL